MSTIDKTEYVRVPCPCGKGKLYVDYCEPDHFTAVERYWWSMGITCGDCNKQYELIELESKAVLVEKGESKKPVGEPIAILTQEAFFGKNRE